MKKLTVKSEITIIEAMKALDKTAEKCLLVVDENNKLLGTLTDGDLRRCILKGKQFSENIEDCFNSEPKILQKESCSDKKARKMLKEKKLDLIPVVDKKGIVIDYITLSNFVENEENKSFLKNIPVVIMAGGMGTRMEPFTKILPKPLVPIHNKPIIEHIIDNFRNLGCRQFYITVNYKARILKAYFEEVQSDYKIKFINEKEPLGTAGSLRYLDGRFDGPFFVTNCDILVKSDYSAIFEFHNKGDFDITLVASAKEYEIPYGTCKLNSEGHLSHIDEKPNYDFLINTGLYVLNPDILELIPKKKFFHITTLIEKVKNMGKKVGVFPIEDDSWIDIGQWTEYKNAIKVL